MRKSIDIEEKTFQKLQFQAIKHQISVKKHIENILEKSVEHKPELERFVDEFNRAKVIVVTDKKTK